MSARLQQARAAKQSSSSTITDGIRVIVSARYVPEQSLPSAKRYAFTYTVRITNEGTEPAQLHSRHWIVTDAAGKVQEVRGLGVVGEQPFLRPGGHFEYTSGAVLDTPTGEMLGAYQMQRPGGQTFQALIAPFRLALPHSLN